MADFSGRLAGSALILFIGVLCLTGLTAGDLVRNEGLRARLAAEALQSGNWLTPMLYGEPHLTKPPGMGIAIGLCSLPWGQVTTVTARLPSIFAGLLVVLLFYRTFARCLGQRAGLIGAAVLPCSALWLDRLPSAEIDMVQLAWVTASLVCLLRAVEVPGNTVAVWFWWLAALACVTGGLFTKWTAPAFFYLTAIPFLAFQGRLPLLLRAPHLVGAGLAAGLMLGWLTLAAQAASWPVLIDTLSREALLRLSPAHHPRPYPWNELALFPMSFLAANLPWSIVALFAFTPSFARLWDERTRLLLLLCQAWLGANLLFWTLVPGHRPRHLLPAQPALAALAALVWIAWLSGRLAWPMPRLAPGRLLTGLLAAWLLVKVAFVASAPERHAGRQPRPGGEMLARLVPAGEMLYLFGLKDEGLLFYYGRPARRLHGPDAVPLAGAWCLLTEAEWRRWQGLAKEVAALRDGQGANVVLIQLPKSVAQENKR